MWKRGRPLSALDLQLLHPLNVTPVSTTLNVYCSTRTPSTLKIKLQGGEYARLQASSLAIPLPLAISFSFTFPPQQGLGSGMKAFPGLSVDFFWMMDWFGAGMHRYPGHGATTYGFDCPLKMKRSYINTCLHI